MRAALILALALGCEGKAPAPLDTHSPLDTGESLPDDTAVEDSAAPACATGEQAPVEGDVCISAAACALTGEQSYEYYGWAVASGGDVDGDGVADLLIGAPVYDVTGESGALTDAGRALLVSGALLSVGGDPAVSQLDGVAYAENNATGVALVGDVNGDGLADALIGAHGNDVAGENAGAAYLVLGAEGGWRSGPITDAASAVFYGESEYARVGRVVTGAGDVDGDGLDELLLTGELYTYDGESEDFRAGRVYLVRGDADLSMLDLADADVALNGSGSIEAAGRGLAAGDMDGDGYADVAVAGPYGGTSYRGLVYLEQGGADLSAWGGALADAPAQIGGEASYDALGWSMAAADMTGDGAADLAIGAPLSDRAYGSGGAVSLVSGGPDLFAGAPEVEAVIDGPWDDWELGAGVFAGGDLNGDGASELLVGAVSAWTNLHTKAGRFYLFDGGAAWPGSVADARAVIHGAAVKDYLGNSAAFGDLDADGTADLVIGSGYINTDTLYDVGGAWVLFSR